MVLYLLADKSDDDADGDLERPTQPTVFAVSLQSSFAIYSKRFLVQQHFPDIPCWQFNISLMLGDSSARVDIKSLIQATLKIKTRLE